jgi:chromosomal replication initiation ATPase DnaA
MAQRQPSLFEFRMGERSPETLVVGEANRDAAHLLSHWRAWPGGALALVGPSGAGKTHLALAWAMETSAREISPRAAPEDAAAIFREGGGKVLVDDADGERDDAMLWRLLDLARSEGGSVLLVGKTPPNSWPSGVEDLRSRLAALPVATLGEPDQALLELILRRLCRDRFIELSEDAARYLSRRMPQTFAAAQIMAAALDQGLAQGGGRGAKPVGLTAAKKALDAAQKAWDGDTG